ncbi:MAG TPA: NUDIX hydrolase [Micromonospora sp.]
MTASPAPYQVRGRQVRFRGPVFSLVTDQVTMPGGRVVTRDYLQHVGAVAVVALDDEDRVALVRQYRHPVGRPLWELPAGLMDVVGEELPAAALRELAEEADLVAQRVELLVDLHTSPGCSNELIRIFLARGLSPVADHARHERRDEEADMQVGWFDLDDAIDMIFRGEITNGPCVAGLLAAARAKSEGWRPLRPATTPVVR